MSDIDLSEYTHKQTLHRMSELNEEISRLGDKQELSTEDEKNWHRWVAEVEALDVHRRKLERDADRNRIAAIQVSVAERQQARQPSGAIRSVSGVSGGGSRSYDSDPLGEQDSVEERRFRDPWDLSEVRIGWRDERQVGDELRSRALSAIERMQGANDEVRKHATYIIENFDDKHGTIARQALLTSHPDYLRAFAKAAVGRKELWTPAEQQAVTRAMSLTDADGGYLVPFQLDPTVIQTSAGNLNEIRQIARQVVATGDIWHGVSAANVSWSYAAEGAEASDNAPPFAQPTVAISKAQGFVPISIEALQDEQNVTQAVASLLAAGRDDLEAAKFILGTGTGEPNGIVHALTTSPVTGGIVNSATADTFTDQDIFNVDGALPARFRRNASWLAHRVTYNTVRGFDTARGGTFWTDLNGDVPAQLIGRGAYEAESMDSTASGTGTENYLMVYGDFNNYVIADRIGMTVEFIPHLLDVANNRPNGTRGWYAYFRNGADVVNKNAFRVLDVT